MRNRRSNKTFPVKEFHTVMCGVVFEIPGKWRRENGLRLLRGCPCTSWLFAALRVFGSLRKAELRLLWASKEMNRNMLFWKASHFLNCVNVFCHIFIRRNNKKRIEILHFVQNDNKSPLSTNHNYPEIYDYKPEDWEFESSRAHHII